MVYGDIGTSPLYAFREAVAAAVGAGTLSRSIVLGVLSLIVWALIVVVAVKYVLLLLRADNNGEGGTLSLTALAARGFGRRTALVFILGVVGASMFLGDLGDHSCNIGFVRRGRSQARNALIRSLCRAGHDRNSDRAVRGSEPGNGAGSEAVRSGDGGVVRHHRTLRIASHS